MKIFPLRKTNRDESVVLAERALRLEAEVGNMRSEVQELRELVGHLDSERDLLLSGIERLRPGMRPPVLGEVMHGLVFRAFDLASFYLALVDWPNDLLEFPFYHEGGRARQHPSRRLSELPGLTGKAIRAGRPLYTRTIEEAQAGGAVFTEAEKGSGLIPSTWYGVPLGIPQRPLGLVSFQSFQADAFPEERRRTLDAFATLLTAALQG